MKILFLLLVLIIVGIFSKQQSWTKRFDLAFDIFTLSMFVKVYGVTISSACGLALRANPTGTTFLHKLGRILNKIQTNHCELAIIDDGERLKAALIFIGAATPIAK